ncbi:hypothetical protein UFOVP112_120 [uncultured Caudovirales phage]|uniref:Baseplate wedge subunit n=1 Tax=uncultured Caudovirales phage TaxID=2100421 RepID=A0A6J5L873_9CAUD|nr:hypothetical protein UFOVP112_120 [uncultured Caudovirales phage]
MAQNTRQTNLLVQQDWTKIYQTFTNADFSSYDFETLRNTMINYIKVYYPDTFNDFLDSSEYLALIDMIAFLGQSLAFRTDLNARENFIDTAQRRDSILKLARMLSYNPKRTTAASGLLKIDSIKTTEAIYDSNGMNLANATVHWNDLTNDNWLEQFTTIFSATLLTSQAFGKPGNSQKIAGIQTDEYGVAINGANLPVAPFTVKVQGNTMNFEAVSATSVGESYIYEDDPTKTGQFNILYRNDNNGNGSNNTGFFLFFKQGSLNATQFSISNAIPNNYVPVATNNITNDDQWLYALDVSGNPSTLWSAVPALPGINVVFNNLTEKNLYQINSLNNDQVNLVFGDGAFANIPQGNFKFYFRTGNGLTHTIGPDDLSAVSVSFNYLSKNNTVETMTVSASLKYTVTNGVATQTLSEIKSAAPQQYYTQNRMITGEDYNIFPQTSFTSIQKVKAVNRTSSGVSLYLDAIDPTGSYSSTNIFSDDGIISANNKVNSTTFSFLTPNDIYSVIYNRIIPIIDSTEMRNYYYGNVSLYPKQNAPTAFGGNLVFVSTSSTTMSSTGFLSNVHTLGNAVQIGSGVTSSLKYIATGASLQFVANGVPFYAAVKSVTSNGDVNEPSRITFGTVVPNTAVLSDSTLTGANCIIPPYKNNLSSELIATMISQIQATVNFGLRFDQAEQTWVNIPPSEIGTSTNWLLKFNYTKGLYTVEYKVIEYTFGSVAETKFYFNPEDRVYDSATGLTVTDSIKILKINTISNTAVPLGSDVTWQIYDTITQADGYVDDSQVVIKFPSTQMLNVPDNPDLYTTVANTAPTRSGLYFQYKHNSPARGRIDPTPINIVDLYILTAAYTTSYVSWLRDLTGTVVEPIPPTSSSLEIAYSTLDNFKTISDTIVYNPAKFKPLFGAKAVPNLRARFQIVKNNSVGLTDNEIKIQVVSAINTYFDPINWNFGETFYFSELAAYLHATLAPNISSIVIVPADNSLVFGNYFQINADPWEIITSAATVNDIDIVSAVTAAQLNLGNTLVGTF